METRITEIAPHIYRLATLVPQIAPPAGFTFNQFLIDAEEPMLFHLGQRALFPAIVEAVRRVRDPADIRWLSFSHVEADECGGFDQWLAAAPKAVPTHGRLGCTTWLHDVSPRPPVARKDGEVLDLGGKRVRWLDTPHLPHNWEAGLMFEETTATLFCSDLFTQFGPVPATTEADIVGPAVQVNARMGFMPVTAATAPGLQRLASLKPRTIALMHGPTYQGDGGAALDALAEHYTMPA